MDVTAAREAEQQIRHDERELRTTIETIPAMVLSLHPDGSIDFVSQSWLDYLGLSLEEMSGGAWRSAIHPEDRDRVLNNWQVALAAGEPFEAEVRHRRADGKYRWFLVRCVPLRDEKGNMVKWYGTHFDIEDRKRAEAAAVQTLADEGHLVRVWQASVGTGRTTVLGLYRADSLAELDGLLGALPLYEWMHVSITPLVQHPNDPAGIRSA